jgi:citrate lyase subunit beta/citryl-CoA lyase
VRLVADHADHGGHDERADQVDAEGVRLHRSGSIADAGLKTDQTSCPEADLRSQTGALEDGLDWARGRIVNAAVAAGLPRPPQSVYPHVRDLDGLARSCTRGRALGHLGRAAIHPGQLPMIEQAYLPTSGELAAAHDGLERLEADAVGTLADGAFVDAAMLGAARQVVELAERYGTSD